MDAPNALTLRTNAPVDVPTARAAERSAALPSFEAAAVEQAGVQDAALPPRRRAQDAAQVPGFPAGPHVAQLLAEPGSSTATGAPMTGLSVYQTALARQAVATGSLISLQA